MMVSEEAIEVRRDKEYKVYVREFRNPLGVFDYTENFYLCCK